MDRLFGGILLLVTGALIIDSLQEKQLSVYMTTNLPPVVEGNSVTIKCNFQPHREYKVKWYYSQTQNSNCDHNSIIEDHHFFTQKSDAWSELYIRSVKTNDSGWYFCKITIDIPYLKEKCSNGTQILVVDAKDTKPDSFTTSCKSATTRDEEPRLSGQVSTHSVESVSYACTTNSTGPMLILSQWWIWLAAAIGSAVLVVTVVVLVLSTRKNKELIYENTKPEESGCWRRKKKNQTDSHNLPPSKKIETIKPLRKYDTYSNNRTRRL